ncbi:hypothetical protein ES703_72053 [subsurface metagenome]
MALRLLKSQRARVKEGSQRRHEKGKPLIPVELPEEGVAVINGIHYRLRCLLRYADHKEYIQSPAANIKGIAQRLLQSPAGIVLAGSSSYLRVVRFRRHLKAEARASQANLLQKVS